MTRPQYAPVPRGYVRVWAITCDWWEAGAFETWPTRERAFANAPHYYYDTGRMRLEDGCQVTPLDVPAGAIPGLAATRKARKR